MADVKDGKAKGSPWAVGLGVLGVAFIAFALFAAMRSTRIEHALEVANGMSVAPTSAGGSTTEVAAAPAPPAVPLDPWTYRTSADKMTDAKTHLACTTSTNQVSQDFPYRNTSADLCVRKAPRIGLDVFVRLNSDGQILCHSSLEDCSLPVRFGKGEVQRFSGGEAADNSSDLVFIRNAPRFIAGLRKAETTLVEIELYQNGRQTLEFETRGLVWPPKD